MTKTIAIVGSERPALLGDDSRLLWFYEIEALYAYLLFHSVDKILYQKSESPCFEKYRKKIHEMHPQIAQLKMKKNTSSYSYNNYTVMIPNLDEIFVKQKLHCSFQPIMKLEAKPDIIGVECLTRISSNEQALDPEFLFHYAEEKLLLVEKDKMCIKNSLKNAPYFNGLFLFINVRLPTLISNGFPNWLLRQINLYQRNPKNIVLELTEQHSFAGETDIERSFSAIKKMGFRIALDDFGSGLSNLFLLDLLKPDYIKISGRFTKQINQNPTRQFLTRSIVELARALNISVIMENIEHKKELDCVLDLGISHGQGFFFFRPLDKKTLLELFAQHEMLGTM